MWGSDEIRVPGDPARSIVDFLAGEFATREPPVTVGLTLPEWWRLGAYPHVLVGDDGGAGRWPISTSPTIRVAVFATGRTAARATAGLCVGLLLARPVPGVATIAGGSAIADSRDEDTGAALALFTVTATARTLTAG